MAIKSTIPDTVLDDNARRRVSLNELLARQYVTLKELATILNVEYRTARRYIRTNKLRAIRVGGHYRIYEEELRRFLTYGNLTEMGLTNTNLTID